MTGDRTYKVTVRHNLVGSVEQIEVEAGADIPQDNLEVTLQLAENFRRNGSIDGDYLFASVHRAKDFALVALDFIKRLTEKSEQGLAQHNFYAEPDWRNPSLAGKQKLQH